MGDRSCCGTCCSCICSCLKFLLKLTLFSIFVAGIVAVILERYHIKQFLEDFIDWLSVNPLYGPFCLAGVHALSEIFFIPGSILTVGAGWAFKEAYHDF